MNIGDMKQTESLVEPMLRLDRVVIDPASPPHSRNADKSSESVLSFSDPPESDGWLSLSHFVAVRFVEREFIRQKP